MKTLTMAKQESDTAENENFDQVKIFEFLKENMKKNFDHQVKIFKNKVKTNKKNVESDTEQSENFDHVKIFEKDNRNRIQQTVKTLTRSKFSNLLNECIIS